MIRLNSSLHRCLLFGAFLLLVSVNNEKDHTSFIPRTFAQQTKVERKWCPRWEGRGQTPVSCVRPEQCPETRLLWTGGGDPAEQAERRLATCGENGALVCCLPAPMAMEEVRITRTSPWPFPHHSAVVSVDEVPDSSGAGHSSSKRYIQWAADEPTSLNVSEIYRKTDSSADAEPDNMNPVVGNPANSIAKDGPPGDLIPGTDRRTGAPNYLRASSDPAPVAWRHVSSPWTPNNQPQPVININTGTFTHRQTVVHTGRGNLHPQASVNQGQNNGAPLQHHVRRPVPTLPVIYDTLRYPTLSPIHRGSPQSVPPPITTEQTINGGARHFEFGRHQYQQSTAADWAATRDSNNYQTSGYQYSRYPTTAENHFQEQNHPMTRNPYPSGYGAGTTHQQIYRDRYYQYPIQDSGSQYRSRQEEQDHGYHQQYHQPQDRTQDSYLRHVLPHHTKQQQQQEQQVQYGPFPQQEEVSVGGQEKNYAITKDALMSARSGPAATQPGVRSAQMCDKYSRWSQEDLLGSYLIPGEPPIRAHLTNCHRFAHLVVGGQNVTDNEFPHMAAIGYRGAEAKGVLGWFCGGSLISDQFVMTAAHCSHTAWGRPTTVRLGTPFLYSDEGAASITGVDIEVADVLTHPGYSPPARYHDIALLRLSAPAPLSVRLRPACLPPPTPTHDRDAQDPAPPQSVAVATGWGRLDYDGDSSDILQKVALRVSSLDECARAFENERSTVRLTSGLGPGMLCAGDAHSNRDTCQGDSGGPLQVALPDNQCVFRVVGITSFGRGCGLGLPAVYTRVSAYVQWIEDIVWPQQ